MWRRPEPVLDHETLYGIIQKLMAIDDKLPAARRWLTRKMAKRKRTPDEREELRQLKAKWEQERRDFEALAERLQARWREEDERRERRRRALRRLIPFVRSQLPGSCARSPE